MLEACGPMAFREISFCLPNGSYVRNIAIKDAQQLREKLSSMRPAKIDFGSIYKSKSNQRDLVNFSRRELVFDLDASDYDAVRSCCSEKKICEQCFLMLSLSARLLDWLLRYSFGFRDIKWFFSGRRGLHGWVFDKQAFALTSTVRKSIVSFVSNVFRKSVAMDIIPDSFKADFVGSALSLLSILNIEKTAKTDSMLMEHLKRSNMSSSNLDSAQKEQLMQYFNMLAVLLRPRIDANVTHQYNHLIKSPYSVHPDTGMCPHLKDI